MLSECFLNSRSASGAIRPSIFSGMVARHEPRPLSAALVEPAIIRALPAVVIPAKAATGANIFDAECELWWAHDLDDRQSPASRFDHRRIFRGGCAQPQGWRDRSSSGSLAMLAAMRRASSPWISLE
jgi:hypothetical protein